MRKGWIRSYYDACAFYSWEPQHLCKPKKRQPGEDLEQSMLKALMRREVPLNHLFDFFFALVPASVVDFISDDVFGQYPDSEAQLIGRDFVTRYNLPGEVTQPDLLFDGASIRAIELKIGSKTSAEQLTKYAYLFEMMDRSVGANRSRKLLLIGDGSAEKIAQPSLIELVVQRQLDGFISNPDASEWIVKKSDPETVRAALERMALAFVNYTWLAERLKLVSDQLTGDGLSFDIARSLFSGLLEEITRREFSPRPGQRIFWPGQHPLE
jgi:hypothetical protein